MINRRTFLSLAGLLPIGSSLSEGGFVTSAPAAQLRKPLEAWTPVTASELMRDGFQRIESIFADHEDLFAMSHRIHGLESLGARCSEGSLTLVWNDSAWSEPAIASRIVVDLVLRKSRPVVLAFNAPIDSAMLRLIGAASGLDFRGAIPFEARNFPVFARAGYVLTDAPLWFSVLPSANGEAHSAVTDWVQGVASRVEATSFPENAVVVVESLRSLLEFAAPPTSRSHQRIVLDELKASARRHRLGILLIADERLGRERRIGDEAVFESSSDSLGADASIRFL